MSAIQFDRQEKAHQAQRVLSQALDFATAGGASSAEASLLNACGVEVNARMAQVESIEYENSQAFGITVYFGTQKGSASSSDMTPESIKKTVASACAIAKYISQDQYNGLADRDLLIKDIADLDLYHPWSVSVDEMIDTALQCESSALSKDKIVNTDGAGVETSHSLTAYANTNDFFATKVGTVHSIYCVAVAGDSSGMQRDAWSSVRRRPQALSAPQQIGERSADRALARLNARKIKSCKTPVIFDSKTTRSLISSFFKAISGESIYRNTSFLPDSLGQSIFASDVHIIEQPLIPQGLYSSPFDAEGMATEERKIIDKGVLQNYILNSYSARKLSLRPTGNAGGIRNPLLSGNTLPYEELIKKMGTGLIAIELIGNGINPVTGDFSQGAAGFWVENGEIAYPVEEITLAGNLKQMFSDICALGDDLDEEGNLRCPSILVDNMTVAGI